eukprot:scaffold1967_cov199-Alexandrium_tamarense.AAC.41
MPTSSPSTSFLLFITLSIILQSTTASNPSHAITKHKAPNSSTPTHQSTTWTQDDAALHAYIAKSIPAVLEHTGSESFDEHLKGVQGILRGWGSPEYLCSAGLFHSIYGTEGFQGFSLPLSERDAISTVDDTVFHWTTKNAKQSTSNDESIIYTFYARPELGRFTIHLNKEEWIDFIELTLADWLDQVQGAAETASSLFRWNVGEAYAYRRTAYAKMVEILSNERPERLATKVRDVFDDVYGTESTSTRHLVQIRTPPMSEAAERALDALRSAGEDVMPDFAPCPSRDTGEL